MTHKSIKALINGVVYSPSLPGKEACSPFPGGVLVEGETIRRVGTTEDILREGGKGCTVVALQGGFLLPGFNDSHMHVLSDLTRCGSTEEVKTCVRKALKNSPGDSGWLTGRGWNQENFALPCEGPSTPFFDASLLRDLETSRPIFLERVCGHIGVVNFKGLEILDIPGKPPSVEALADRDEKGYFTGVLREQALEKARSVVYSHTLETVFPLYVQSLQALAKKRHHLGANR